MCFLSILLFIISSEAGVNMAPWVVLVNFISTPKAISLSIPCASNHISFILINVSDYNALQSVLNKDFK